jgi:uncharacterized protein
VRAGVRRWLPFAGTSAALLAWRRLAVPALPAAPAVRTAAGLAAVSVLLGAARRGGLSGAELGLARRAAAGGAREGGAALGLVTAGYVGALAVPAARRRLADAGAGTPVPEVALRAIVLIPLGTVLCEEVAFRGVLHALARRATSPLPAVLAGSAVFGLWHPGPVPVVGATALGGAVLGWLRHRTGSVLAPGGLHLGTNSAGLVAAAVAARLPRG